MKTYQEKSYQNVKSPAFTSVIFSHKMQRLSGSNQKSRDFKGFFSQSIGNQNSRGKKSCIFQWIFNPTREKSCIYQANSRYY
jgi:hypothetical protein